MTDFHARRPLGQTGLRVSRLGIGSSFGTPARVVEKAFDHGVNYLYWGSFRRPAFGRAIRHLARRHREELVLTVQSYSLVPRLVAPSVEMALLRTRLDYFDILLLGAWNQRPSEAFVEVFQRLREQGKVRFLAVSTHNRPLFPLLFDDFQSGTSPFDVFMLRYNAAHRGAEKDVFPFVPDGRPPGIITYTATRWGHLLDPAKMPDGETAPCASDCYRFALSHPVVDLTLTGLANEEQLDEALRALDRGPMDEEELEHMRRVGEHIYRNYRPKIADGGDAKDSGTPANSQRTP
jgi:aryl-alcohol dehydrogenase-like predicted oxidoreductase